MDGGLLIMDGLVAKVPCTLRKNTGKDIVQLVEDRGEFSPCIERYGDGSGGCLLFLRGGRSWKSWSRVTIKWTDGRRRIVRCGGLPRQKGHFHSLGSRGEHKMRSMRNSRNRVDGFHS